MADYVHRFYRRHTLARDLTSFRVVVGESDLLIWAESDLSEEVRRFLLFHRGQLEDFMARHPRFGESFVPYPVPEGAPAVVRLMAEAAERAGVGPMAAVAGALAEVVGKDIIDRSYEIIVENGGDIYLRSSRERKVGLFAGPSPLSGKIAFVLPPTGDDGVGICTSSATVGPSYSAGRADAAVVLAEGAALADAAATALGNRLKSPEDIPKALEFTLEIPGVLGAAAVMGEVLGVVGELELARS
jgi:ApbE superfamily uncharacterized protein (UPF0280 family)